MRVIRRSTVFDAPVEEVWAIVRDFNDWPSWHPNVDTSEIEGDVPNGAVGCLRRLTGQPDQSARERLIGLSDHEHWIHYNLEWASALDMSGYVATMRLHPITDGDRTFLEWQGSFEAAPELEDALAEGIATMIYENGFTGIRARLAGQPHR